MKFCVLSSGSKGNCTYIEIGTHKFLIDIGTNFLYTSNKLNEIGVDPKEIEAVFITHIHEDHINGLKRFIKIVNPMIYLTKKIYDNFPIELTKWTFLENSIIIDNINIDSIKLSHDTPECKGYIFESNNKQLVYITDTGYINKKILTTIVNKDMYIIESNHDVKLLMNGKYPFFLQQRILSDKGHLSNKDCSRYLSTLIGNKTKYIVLAHLSEENNTKELASFELNKMLEKNNFNIKKTYIAKQDESLETIEV